MNDASNFSKICLKHEMLILLISNETSNGGTRCLRFRSERFNISVKKCVLFINNVKMDKSKILIFYLECKANCINLSVYMKVEKNIES